MLSGAFAAQDAKREPADALDRRLLDVKTAANDPVIHAGVHPASRSARLAAAATRSTYSSGWNLSPAPSSVTST